MSRQDRSSWFNFRTLRRQGRTTKGRHAQQQRKLRYETLEDRRLLAITVDTLVDEADGVGVGTGTSLRDAIAAAAPSETIDFSVTGTIGLTLGELEIANDVIIDGSTVTSLTVNAGGGGRIFNIGVASGTSPFVEINNLGLGGGVAFDGGAIISQGTLILNDVGIALSQASGKGGAVFSTGDLTMNGGAIYSSSSKSDGGAIYSLGSLVTDGVTISGNFTRDGGNGASAGESGEDSGRGGGVWSSGITSISNSTISGNSTGDGGNGYDSSVPYNWNYGGNAGDGGGLWLAGDATITNSIISGNHTGDGGNGMAYYLPPIPPEPYGAYLGRRGYAGDGGGIFTAGNLTITGGSQLTGNTTGIDGVTNYSSASYNGGAGGGIANIADTLSVIVSSSTIDGNTAGYVPNGKALASGGGLNIRGDITITGSTISNNNGSSGGGLLVGGGSSTTAMISGTSFTGNSAVDSGGGISNFGITTIESSVIDSNISGQDGGGIYVFSSTTITDSTISNNTAERLGGGISLSASNGNTYLIDDTTISNNLAASGGGLYAHIRGGDINLTNSTVIDNTAALIGGGIRPFFSPYSSPTGGTFDITDTTIAGNTAGFTASSGELARWRANGTAADDIGTHDGTIENGVTYGPGKNGQAFVFNDVNDRVTIPDDSNDFGDQLSAGFTIEMWAQFDSVPIGTLSNPEHVLIDHNEGPGQTNKWAFHLGGQTLSFHINTTAGANAFLLQTPFAPNPVRWYHLAVVRNGNEYRLFIDGELVATETGIGLPSINAPITLGSREGFSLRGSLDEVAIHDNGLTEAQIKAIYNDGARTVSGLGGAVAAHLVPNGVLTLNQSTLNNNEAAKDGGGVHVEHNGGGTFTSLNSTISGNRADRNGGGVFVVGQPDQSDAIQHATITLNHSGANANGVGTGGGIYLAAAVELDLDHTIVAENFDGESTGGTADLFTDPLATLTASFTLVGDNTGSGLAATPDGAPDANGNLIGPAFFQSSLTVSVQMAAMGDFEAGDGGSILEDSYKFEYSNNGLTWTPLFTSSVDEVADATYTLEDDSTVLLNDPLSVAGTELNNNFQTLTATIPMEDVDDQLQIRFVTTTDGGAEAFAFRNLFVRKNNAGNEIVGRALSTAADIFAGFTADSDFGETNDMFGIHNASDSLPGAMRDHSVSAPPDTVGIIKSADSFNFFGVVDTVNNVNPSPNPSPKTATWTFNIEGDVIDPLLGPLADNLGPTFTHNLLPGSPAIDAGDLAISSPPTFDQRGNIFNRVIDGDGDSTPQIDIGAVELITIDTLPFPLLVDTAADENNGDYSIGDISLREALSFANLVAGADTIDFDPALAGSTITLLRGQLDVTDSLTVNGLGADLLTIDASGNDPTPGVNNGDGSRVFNINGTGILDVDISGLTITGGDVLGNGGGILSRENLDLSQVTVSGNAASNSGGGVLHSSNSAPLLIDRSTFSHNEAGEEGGGLWSDTALTGVGVGRITNSTFSGNSAAGRGGGIRNVDGLLVIEHSTITANQGSGVSGFGDNFTRTHVYSSIVAGNIGTDVAVTSSIINSFVSLGYNLIGTGADIDGGPANALDNFNSDGDMIGIIDPLLGPLGDNGGPTFTHALQPGSPALNAGDPSLSFDPAEFDQRGDGFPRVRLGRIDIGAFESPGFLSEAVAQVLGLQPEEVADLDTGLLVWLDGNDPSSFTIDVGSGEALWLDKSGNASSAVQSDASSAPTQSGPWIDFSPDADGAGPDNDDLLSLVLNNAPTGPWTGTVAFEVDANSADQGIVFPGGFGEPGFSVTHHFNEVYSYFGSGGSNLRATADIGESHALVTAWAGGTTTDDKLLWVNGADTTTGNGVPVVDNNLSTMLTLGDAVTSLDGRIGTVIIHSGVLSETARQQLEGYLAAVWGTSLPVGHPYAPGPVNPGDYNLNGTVDAADYTVWLDQLGSSGTAFEGADGDGSGVVDNLDYNLWKANFGNTGAVGVSLPASVPPAATTVSQIVPTSQIVSTVDAGSLDFVLTGATLGNGNGAVDAVDLSVWQGQFGQTTPPASSKIEASIEAVVAPAVTRAPQYLHELVTQEFVAVDPVLPFAFGNPIALEARDAAIALAANDLRLNRAVDDLIPEEFAIQEFQRSIAVKPIASRPRFRTPSFEQAENLRTVARNDLGGNELREYVMDKVFADIFG